jgi:hypothetical protein
LRMVMRVSPGVKEVLRVSARRHAARIDLDALRMNPPVRTAVKATLP